MKCKCCENRIWVEPAMSTLEVNIFADEAEEFANDILREVEIVRAMK